MQLEFRQRANIDVLEAWTYYEEQQDGLGTRFVQRLDELLEKIAANPQHYAFIDHTKSRRDAALIIFPYIVVFEIIGDVVLIYRVFNTHQNPASLQDE